MHGRPATRALRARPCQCSLQFCPPFMLICTPFFPPAYAHVHSILALHSCSCLHHSYPSFTLFCTPFLLNITAHVHSLLAPHSCSCSPRSCPLSLLHFCFLFNFIFTPFRTSICAHLHIIFIFPLCPIVITHFTFFLTLCLYLSFLLLSHVFASSLTLLVFPQLLVGPLYSVVLCSPIFILIIYSC